MSKILKLLQKDKTLSTHLKPVGETKTYLSTNVLSLNVLFSGRIDGGIGKGYINQISADSSLGKCSFRDEKINIYADDAMKRYIENKLQDL